MVRCVPCSWILTGRYRITNLEGCERWVLWLDFQVGLSTHNLSKGTEGKKERPCEGLYPGGDSEEDNSNISEDLPLEVK